MQPLNTDSRCPGVPRRLVVICLLAGVLSAACAGRAGLEQAPVLSGPPALNCQAMAYVAPNQDPVLRMGPSVHAEPIATLQPHQYLCVVATDDLGWKLVKAVPLPSGQHRLVCAPGASPDCVPMGSYPIGWRGLTSAYGGSPCKTVTQTDQQTLRMKVQGQCPTGWLPDASVRVVGD